MYMYTHMDMHVYTHRYVRLIKTSRLSAQQVCILLRVFIYRVQPVIKNEFHKHKRRTYISYTNKYVVYTIHICTYINPTSDSRSEHRNKKTSKLRLI